MSKQRTQRRGQRQPPSQRAAREAREARGAKAARRQQRHETRQQAKTKPGRGRTGWAGMRRSRGQKLGIGAVAAVAIALIWIFLDWPLAIGLSALVLLALPAFVVLTMGRRY